METIVLPEGIPFREVGIPVEGAAIVHEGAPGFAFPPAKPFGSGAVLQDESGGAPVRVLLWRGGTASSNVVEVFEVALEGPLAHNAVSLTFPSAVFPKLALAQTQGGCALFALSAEGRLYRVALLSPFDVGGAQSVLVGVQATSVAQRSLAADLTRLEGPTDLAIQGTTVLVGTRSGTVLGVPVGGSFEGPVFDLKEAEAIMRRLWSGVLNRPMSVSPVAAVCSFAVEGTPTLVVLHQDSTLRLWDIASRARPLHSQPLPLPENWGHGTIPARVWAEEDNSEEGKPIHFVVHLQERAAPGDKGVLAVFSLESREDAFAVEYHHTVLGVEGDVVDVQLAGGQLWLLLKTKSSTRLLHATDYAGGGLEACTLVEEQLADLLLLEEAPEQDALFLQYAQLSEEALGGPVGVAEMVEGRLLAPEVLSRAAILQLLRQKGQQWAAADIAALSLDRMRTELRALVASQGVGGGPAAELARWRALGREYVMAWHGAHAPLALVKHPQQSALLLLRQESLALLRDRHATEAPKPEAVSCPEGWPPGAGEWGLAAAFVGQARRVRQQLGKLAATAFADLLLAASDPQATLLPFYIHLLLAAPLLDGAESSEREAFQGSQRQFVVSLASSLHGQQAGAGGWAVLLQAATGYLQWMQGRPSTAAAGEARQAAGVVKAAAEASAGQLARAQLADARDLLLLLAFAERLPTQVGLPVSEVASLRRGALVAAQGDATWAVLLQWLAGTPSESEGGRQADDFSARLSSLHLSSEAPAGSAGGGTLLQVALQHLPAPSAPQPAGGAPVAALRLALSQLAALRGGAEPKGPGSVSQQAVELAMLLCTCGHYALMQPFLQQVEWVSRSGEPASSAAVAFLLGLCALAQACALGPHSEAGREQAEKAQQAFFRAVGGVESRDPLLQRLLTSFGRRPPLPGDSREVQQLAYFDLVTWLFERYQLTAGALTFAQAALQEAQYLSRQLEGAPEGMAVEGPALAGVSGAAMGGCLARLWSTVFELCLELRRFSCAYAALAANPSQETRHMALRRFVAVLADHNALKVLCGRQLPYAGLLTEVENELLRMAEMAEVGAPAGAGLYCALYSLHALRQNWRSAAWAMLRLAERLEEEAVDPVSAPTLDSRRQALLAALQALNLLSPENRWLQIRRPPLVPDAPSSNKRPRTGRQPDVGEVVDAAAVAQEQALVTAALTLLRHGHPLPHYPWRGGAVVEALVTVGEYEAAFSLAHLVFTGLTRQEVLEGILVRLAERCCHAQLEEERTEHLEAAALVPSTSQAAARAPEAAAAGGHVPATTLWNTLRAYLAQYEGAGSGLRLHVAVAAVVIGSSGRLQLPLWLLERLQGPLGRGMAGQGGHPAGLLRLLLDHGRVRRAAELTLQHLKALRQQRGEGAVGRWKKVGAVWLPHLLLQRLLSHLQDRCTADAANALQWRALLQALQETLTEYTGQAEKDSKDIKCMAEAPRTRPTVQS